jgi:hypothetical protein
MSKHLLSPDAERSLERKAMNEDAGDNTNHRSKPARITSHRRARYHEARAKQRSGMESE